MFSACRTVWAKAQKMPTSESTLPKDRGNSILSFRLLPDLSGGSQKDQERALAQKPMNPKSKKNP